MLDWDDSRDIPEDKYAEPDLTGLYRDEVAFYKANDGQFDHVNGGLIAGTVNGVRQVLGRAICMPLLDDDGNVVMDKFMFSQHHTTMFIKNDGTLIGIPECVRDDGELEIDFIQRKNLLMSDLYKTAFPEAINVSYMAGLHFTPKGYDWNRTHSYSELLPVPTWDDVNEFDQDILDKVYNGGGF